MKISEHVSYTEITKSNTATKKGIANDPNPDQLANIQKLCEEVFEPLRVWVGGAIQINSCFRSEDLNKAIGGALSSQHLANNGAALDIDDNYFKRGITEKNNADMFYFIKNNLDFDQLIWEFTDPDNEDAPAWVHVSYCEGENRKEVLRAIRVNGRTSYVKFE